MKKLYLLFMSFVCLCSLCTFADSPCDKEMATRTKMPNYHQKSYKPNPCVKPTYKNDCFLCTNKSMASLFKCMNLSETQICNAEKIQSKYEQEVLSLNERIACENQKLGKLKSSCAKGSEVRKQKRLIKKLEKKKKEICKCYEKEFKSTLSDMQERQYNKQKRNK